MVDFDGLDTNGSNGLDTAKLQSFISKRDGATTDLRLIQNRAKELLKEVDIDSNGVVSRTEWLIYLTYLHWQAFLDDCVVEKIIEVTKEYKAETTGKGVCIESITQHPPMPRSHRLASMGTRLSSENFGRGGGQALNMAAAAPSTTSPTNRNRNERIHQNPDGTFVTTIEHTDLNVINKCGCF